MGLDVVVKGADKPALADVVDVFGEWERIFTRFSPDSEISRVNATEDESVLVSDLFAHVTSTALAAWRATGGLVDPTLADAVASAGYDRDFASLPPDDPRPAGPPAPGRAGEVGLAGRLLTRPPGLRLDLAGVVKAMAVDETLRILPGFGFVSAGGDLATRGPVNAALPAADRSRFSPAVLRQAVERCGTGAAPAGSSITSSIPGPDGRPARAGAR